MNRFAKIIVGASLLAACTDAQSASAETLADFVKTMRDYDLSAVNGSAPARPLRFYIGENSAFAACGVCLCVTGVMRGHYPNLGIRPTSASPTFSCEQGAAEFEADSELLKQFFDMKTALTKGEVVVFDNEGRNQMTFQLGGAELSPP